MNREREVTYKQNSSLHTGLRFRSMVRVLDCCRSTRITTYGSLVLAAEKRKKKEKKKNTKEKKRKEEREGNTDRERDQKCVCIFFLDGCIPRIK